MLFSTYSAHVVPIPPKSIKGNPLRNGPAGARSFVDRFICTTPVVNVALNLGYIITAQQGKGWMALLASRQTCTSYRHVHLLPRKNNGRRRRGYADVRHICIRNGRYRRHIYRDAPFFSDNMIWCGECELEIDRGGGAGCFCTIRDERALTLPSGFPLAPGAVAGALLGPLFACFASLRSLACPSLGTPA